MTPPQRKNGKFKPQFTYDKETDSAYIKIRWAKFSHTIEHPTDDDVIMDIGINGMLIGIEVLNWSKRAGQK